MLSDWSLLCLFVLQVEDMLRRSFAEFHAQRAQPGKTAALTAGQAQLAAYQNTAWPTCIKGCDRCACSHSFVRGWGPKLQRDYGLVLVGGALRFVVR